MRLVSLLSDWQLAIEFTASSSTGTVLDRVSVAAFASRTAGYAALKFGISQSASGLLLNFVSLFFIGKQGKNITVVTCAESKLKTSKKALKKNNRHQSVSLKSNQNDHERLCQPDKRSNHFSVSRFA